MSYTQLGHIGASGQTQVSGRGACCLNPNASQPCTCSLCGSWHASVSNSAATVNSTVKSGLVVIPRDLTWTPGKIKWWSSVAQRDIGFTGPPTFQGWSHQDHWQTQERDQGSHSTSTEVAEDIIYRLDYVQKILPKSFLKACRHSYTDTPIVF